eukprot:1157900-Pelagomonas_calceolata.AAC.22
MKSPQHSTLPWDMSVEHEHTSIQIFTVFLWVTQMSASLATSPATTHVIRIDQLHVHTINSAILVWGA